MKTIEFEGYTYWYEHKPARNRVDICLATKDPEKYCNGYYLYSDKDPGSGIEFVVVKTDNPNIQITPSTVYTKHVAGSFDTETQLQLCVLCGFVLTDYNGVYWIGETPPGGWSEGKNVYIDGGFKTIKLMPGTLYKQCTSEKIERSVG